MDREQYEMQTVLVDLFDNLYLFWSGILVDAGRVKSLSTAPAATLVVEDRSPEWRGWFFTALGVLCFSFTFPMTRLSLRAFDPILVALVRGAGAGIAAFVYLVLSRSRIPDRRNCCVWGLRPSGWWWCFRFWFR